jgi:hypothetical protein
LERPGAIPVDVYFWQISPSHTVCLPFCCVGCHTSLKTRVGQVARLLGVPVLSLIDMNEPWLRVELAPNDKLKGLPLRLPLRLHSLSPLTSPEVAPPCGYRWVPGRRIPWWLRMGARGTKSHPLHARMCAASMQLTHESRRYQAGSAQYLRAAAANKAAFQPRTERHSRPHPGPHSAGLVSELRGLPSPCLCMRQTRRRSPSYRPHLCEDQLRGGG